MNGESVEKEMPVIRRMILASLAIVCLFAAPPEAFALDPLFDTWIGYDSGMYQNGRFPYGLAAADFNGDGRADVATINWPWSAGFSVILNAGNGTYEQPTHYSSAKPPLDLAVADIDGDGDLDVILPNTGEYWEGTSISVFRNQGDGTFSAQQQSACGSGPVGITAGDLDADGDVDIAVANYGYLGQGNTVSVLRNTGSGSFAAPVSYVVGESPYRLAAGDLSGDGLPDLAVARDDQSLSILTNTGNATFGPASYHVTGGIVYSGDSFSCVAIADVDRDGDADVLYSCPWTQSAVDFGGFALFRNTGSAALAPAELISFGIRYHQGVTGMSVADLDGDSWPDVVGAHWDNTANGGFVVARGNGQGGFLTGVRYHSGQAPFDVDVADVNGDGDLDVLVANDYSIEVTVHENQGDGTFFMPPTFEVESLAMHLDAADIDDDGDLDIATSRGGISLLRSRGDGTFDPYVLLVSPRTSRAVKFARIDGDQAPDLLWIDDEPPYWGRWRRNLGNGTFGPAIAIPLPNCGAGDIIATDLDNDGDLDVVATEEGACFPGAAQWIDIALNRGDGTFDPAWRVDIVEWGPREVTSADFDADGINDLAVGVFGAYGYGQTVVVLIGYGDGFFEGPVVYPVGPGPEGVVAADLNGDGAIDLATNNTGPNGTGIESMSVLLNRGDGTFAPAVTYLGSYSSDLLGTTAIVAGDVDVDGAVDLLVSNFGSNDVSYYHNRGDGTFEPQTRYGTRNYPLDLLYADFTGDDIPDLAATAGLPPSGMFGAVTIVTGLSNATAVDDPAHEPSALTLRLEPGVPNPFTQETTISFALPAAGRVPLAIFDVQGRRVATLVDGLLPAGPHNVVWNGNDPRNAKVAAGVYFSRLDSQSGAKMSKLVLMK